MIWLLIWLMIKKLNPVVISRILKNSIAFITQWYFKVSKDVRLNSTQFFIMKILHRRELQQIALNHTSDIYLKDFIKIYKKCTAEPYSFLVNDTTSPSDNPLRFRKNFKIKYIIKNKYIIKSRQLMIQLRMKIYNRIY